MFPSGIMMMMLMISVRALRGLEVVWTGNLSQVLTTGYVNLFYFMEV